MKLLHELETREEAEDRVDESVRHYRGVAQRIKAGETLSAELEADSHVVTARAAYALMLTLPCAPEPASQEDPDADLEVA